MPCSPFAVHLGSCPAARWSTRLGDDLVVFDDQDLGHTGMRASLRERSFEELRVGFTASVSHELRTPLARLLALLDNASLRGADTAALIDQARQEVEADGRACRRRALSQRARDRACGRRGSATSPVAPIVRDVVEALRPSAGRHGAGTGHARRRGRHRCGAAADPSSARGEPCRERHPLRGRGARCTLSACTRGRRRAAFGRRQRQRRPEEEVSRLFERFFRGTGPERRGAPGSGSRS